MARYVLTAFAYSTLLAEHGLNELPAPKQPSVPVRVMRQLADPLSIMLLAAGLVTLLVLGEVPESARHPAGERGHRG
ncbi:cation-transporting P-type ATPase [Nonomuraea sp. NPDC026600]|uniref:cation-transporting P-type ATPase n=1 Tax=Nonomuraea sp. NPDC026600 TaxID=3155363 RepID=UPI0033CC0209